MTDLIRTPAEALSSGPALIEWCGADGMRWGNALQTAIALNHASGVDDLGEWFGGWFCNAIETARALVPRIAAPDDEALVDKAACAIAAAGPCGMVSVQRCREESMVCRCHEDARAVLAALREAGALR